MRELNNLSAEELAAGGIASSGGRALPEISHPSEGLRDGDGGQAATATPDIEPDVTLRSTRPSRSRVQPLRFLPQPPVSGRTRRGQAGDMDWGPGGSSHALPEHPATRSVVRDFSQEASAQGEPRLKVRPHSLSLLLAHPKMTNVSLVTTIILPEEARLIAVCVVCFHLWAWSHSDEPVKR